MQLCLGTVQQGMDYGLTGGQKPDLSACINLYSIAVALGVCTFDTAAQYGDAENVLGAFLKSAVVPYDRINIISKPHPNCLNGVSETDYYGNLKRELENSLKRLGISTLDGYILHNPAHVHNEAILQSLNKLKDTGLTARTGASVYTPEQALVAAKSPLVDYIQVPYNVIDKSLDECGFFDEAKARGKTVFARSAFLQGLLLMDLGDVATKLPIALPYVDAFHSAIQDVPSHEACISYVRAKEGYIDYLVMGVDSVNDLRNNISAFFQTIDNDLIARLKSLPSAPEKVVRPDLWPTAS